MISSRRSAAGRSGATLTEVLMSLLIMGVGIVSVITMFPLGVLRSIQATQLTNSRLLKQNVQQALRTQYYSPPSVVPGGTGAEFHFDLMNQSTVRRPAPAGSRTQFRGEWQPNTQYFDGEIVVPTRKAGSSAPTPNLWFECVAALPTAPETSGEIEPSWVPGALISDGTMFANPTPPPPPTGWLARVVNAQFTGLPVSDRPFQPIALNGAVYDALNYVVDPLGWQMFSGGFGLDTTVTSANDFGYRSLNGVGGAVAPANYPGFPAAVSVATFTNHRLLRVNGGLTDLTSVPNSLALAEGIGMGGDTWTTEVTSLVDSVGPVPIPPSAPWLTANRSAVFPNTVDLTVISQATLAEPGTVRIVLTNEAQNQTAVRVLQPLDPATPAVDLATNTVRWREPLPTGFAPTGQARLERIDKRYSWLATVNKTPQGSTNVTVAIIAKRSFTPDDEHVYVADTFTGLDDQAIVTWGAGEPTPLIREGNYALDAYTARWYRVLAVSGKDSPVTVTFDERFPINHQVTTGRLIFMRGIVEIFEL